MTITELERLKLTFVPGTVNLSRLPVGSTMDVLNGRFSWGLSSGFLDKHRLEFMETDKNGKRSKQVVMVTIVPKK